MRVQIPVELASYVMEQTEVCGKYLVVRKKGNSTHRLAKYFGFYLLLKAESPDSGWIQNYAKQIPQLAQNFGISQRTFFNYMRELERLQIAFREGTDIRLIGWAQLGKLLDINTRTRETIQFNYNGKQKIQWWFAAIEIKANQEAQAHMVWRKVHKNSDIENELLTAMVKRGFDLSKRNNPEYFSSRLFGLYVESFRTGTEVHDLLINIRADVNRGVKKIAAAWEMSAQLVSYWKQKMRDQGIIGYSKIQVVSEYSLATRECHKNKFCHVIWNDKMKERVWFLCDQINVVMPWKWTEFLEKMTPKTEAHAA